MKSEIDEHLRGVLEKMDEILETHQAAVYFNSFYRAGPPRIFIYKESIKVLVRSKVGIHFEDPPFDLESRGYRELDRGRFALAYEFRPGESFDLEFEGILMERHLSRERLIEEVREIRDKLGFSGLIPLLGIRRIPVLKRDGVLLRIKKLDPGITLPSYAHPGDAGLDICSAEDVTLEPGERAMVSTGFAMALPDGYAAFVQPRSGLAARNGISIANTPGLIDCHYRGEVKVILVNLGRETFQVERGDRIAQMVIQRVETADIEVVDELGETVRGEGGFGSTGL